MQEKNVYKDKELTGKNGVLMLIVAVLLVFSSVFMFSLNGEEGFNVEEHTANFEHTVSEEPKTIQKVTNILGVIFNVLAVFIFIGLKLVNPNECLVLTLFGKYYGTLKNEGFYFVNPFLTPQSGKAQFSGGGVSTNTVNVNLNPIKKTISLKETTLNNKVQKVNDSLGNPIEIGAIVIWKVVDAAKAVFSVENYLEFLSIQVDSVIRNVAQKYPYDLVSNESDITLRSSSSEVAKELEECLQEKVIENGIKIIEVKITHLAYAQEIAAAMLQRQQASAIIDAKKLIVEGAVGMVQMALTQLEKENVVSLDEERKAAMISNLLVVLCANKDTQPVVNSGSIY